MKIFDSYIFKNLTLATIFVSLTLAVVVFLTQSLKFMELVINSGASSGSFILLTLLTLPRFLEIIIPLSLMAATIFVYNRMMMDSELVAIRAVGYSPFALARPALLLALAVTVFLWSVAMWASPRSMSSMQEMRQLIKASFSVLLFREGVFNEVGKGLTVYMRERSDNGDLHGLMIHDSRETQKNPSTVLAKRGVIVSNDEGHQVVVFDGTRQEYDPKLQALHRLNFERYTIDLPETSPVRVHVREPEERTIIELLFPSPEEKMDARNLRASMVEIHRRLISPLLAIVYTLISCAALLLGPLDRRGQGLRIAAAIASVVIIQGLYLTAVSAARHSDWGLIFMYFIVVIPLGFTGFLFSGKSDRFRYKFLMVRGLRS